MIQRIQTVFLLFALVFTGLTFIAPVWYFEADGTVERIQGFQHVLQSEPSTVMVESIEKTQLFFQHPESLRMIVHSASVVLGIISLVLIVMTILAYSDRKRQMRLAQFVIILTMIQILGFVFLSLQAPVYLNAGAVNRADYGFALPVLTIIMAWLAHKNIKKDDDLVRSVDRIR